MFDQRHYVPILKAKEAEYSSLAVLSDNVKSHLTPMIEIPPIPWDFSKEAPGRTIDKHLEKVASKLQKCWVSKRPIFIDLASIPNEERMQDSRHPLTYILDTCREKNLTVIPVTNLGRDGNYQDAIRTGVSRDKTGLCVRLSSDDFQEYSVEITSKVRQLAGDMGLTLDAIDLLIDFAEIGSGQSGTMSLAAKAILETLREVDRYRSLTLAATAFPRDLGRLPASQVSLIPRTEWTIWSTLAKGLKRTLRIPTFGDYAIANPELTEIDPRIMQMSEVPPVFWTGS